MPQECVDKATRFGSQYRDYLQRSFANFQFTPNELSVLSFLFTHAPGQDTASDIARACFVSKALVTRSVDSLSQRGFIEPKRSTDDRRIIHLSLTNKSMELGRTISQAKRELDRKLFEGVPKEDLEAFERVILTVESNMQRLTKPQIEED